MPDESETVPIERFADEPGPAGEAIGMYRETLRRGAPEAVAWKRLEGRMRKPRALRPLPLAAFAGALFATLLLLWRTMVDHPTIAPTSERAGSDRSSIQEPTANPGVELSVGAVPVRIPSGALRISPTLEVTGGPLAVARVAIIEGRRTVTVDSGPIEVRSQERDPEKRLRVVAEPYAFDDIGTVFAVERDAEFVQLSVREGLVRVLRGADDIATVGAGQTWRGSIGEPPKMATNARVATNARAPIAPPTARPLTSESGTASPQHLDPRSCHALAGAGQQGAALACYEKLSRGADLAAQTALYEVGNLQRNGGDLAGALSAYRSYVLRFPSGPLWTEAKLSAVEVLTKLARYREALDESASLLASRPGMERADELRLLRGNLYREALGDLRHAADEYELASRGTSQASGDALFLRGTCVEALGDIALAASIYSTYLERGYRSHAADAQQRRSALSRRK